MLGWIRHEPLGFLEMTSECEDAEDMTDYIQNLGEREKGGMNGGEERKNERERRGR